MAAARSDVRAPGAYETFTTELAAAIGLALADIALRAVGRTHYTQIVRYDHMHGMSRRGATTAPGRLLSGPGVSTRKAISKHRGPSFARCYRPAQEDPSEPALDARHLRD